MDHIGMTSRQQGGFVMSYTHLENITKEILIVNDKELTGIACGINLLIINSRTDEYIVFANNIMKS